jgi:cytochrome o ubiquinol oxidase subunit 1
MSLILGRLTWQAIPLHEPIIFGTLIAVVAGAVVLLAIITYCRFWGVLWRTGSPASITRGSASCTSILGLVMLLRGFSDALMMRAQQAVSFGHSMGFLPPHHYDQVFTAHGVIMIFFVAMPLVTGLMNFVVPLQIGARDVAFPFLNNFSFWMTAAGARWS